MVYGRRALSCFSVGCLCSATENLVKHSECYIETSDGADKGASCCKCGI